MKKNLFSNARRASSSKWADRQRQEQKEIENRKRQKAAENKNQKEMDEQNA